MFITPYTRSEKQSGFQSKPLSERNLPLSISSVDKISNMCSKKGILYDRF